MTYFPHLIAGPILHHKDMIPQFERAETKRPDAHLILCGLIIFAIGLFKKTCLADGIQPLVALAFGSRAPSFDQAWIGALAYTFQLYFDFSGYSDMAIGMSLMFGIFLPVNFNSPYKATSIIEFWRRWHMTLSQFLRDYLYIPLGGNRRGRVLRYVNLMVTMLLGGLWHGAAWTFVVWGALHGAYLCVNHAWSRSAPQLRRASRARPHRRAMLTFLAVVVAWVFFRAEACHRRYACFERWPIRQHRPRPQGDRRRRLWSRSMPRWPGWRRTRKRSWDTTTTTAGSATTCGQADAAAVPLCRRRGAGVRDSRHPEPQRIHLFPVLMRGAFTHLRRLLWRSIDPACWARRRSISSSIPCNCFGPRGFIRRSIPTTRACRMPG